MTSHSDYASVAVQDPGMALCLSGGGFRATMFHLGAVRRLNELGVLSQLSTITSVSGGSILNGILATRWAQLRLGNDGIFVNFDEVVANQITGFCRKDLRTPLLLGIRLSPANWGVLIRDWFSVSANFLAAAYDPLYRQKLGDLPAPGPDNPRFVFCATNVRTGACWHFHGGPNARMGDFYTGYCDAIQVPISYAVAASSAFPPGFSALRLKIPKGHPFTRVDPWGEVRVMSPKRGNQPHSDPRMPALLTDGGVYDNLGVEPVWQRYKTILVSDAGRPFESVRESGQAVIPRLKRVIDIGMEQVAAVRKRWLVEEFVNSRRVGALWSLHTLLEDFPLADRQGYGSTARILLNKVRTDLNAFSEGEMACLENHGYSLADAAIRSRAKSLCPNPTSPFRWPHSKWSTDTMAVGVLDGSDRRNLWRDLFRYITGRSS